MGACLNHSALFSHQTHFLLHCQRHNSNTCVLEMSKNETVVPNSIFLPRPCPHSTSSYPPASQYILRSFFFLVFNDLSFLSTQGLLGCASSLGIITFLPSPWTLVSPTSSCIFSNSGSQPVVVTPRRPSAEIFCYNGSRTTVVK